jgi:sec-independent protein translocase protein TatA
MLKSLEMMMGGMKTIPLNKYLSVMNTVLGFLSGVGFQEILLIGVLVLVLFGAKKVPEFMKGLGKGIREFKDGVKDVKNQIDEDAPKG